MDNPEQPTLLSFCTGYAGIEIGIEKAIGELYPLAYVEIEAYAIANLVSKMEKNLLVPAPIWTDIRTFPSEIFRGKVDILAGGYPCQPFSLTGKRRGSEDPRHLWPFIKRAINIIRPGFCFFENVEGHIENGLDSVLKDLVEMDYIGTWGIFSAAEVGLPHLRKRVFILGKLGNTDCSRFKGDEFRSGIIKKRWKKPIGPVAKPGQVQFEWEEPRVLEDAGNNRRPGRGQELADNSEGWPGHDEIEGSSQPFDKCNEPEEAESSLGRTVDGPSCRVDRLRLLGNGVIPESAAIAFKTLLERLL